MQSSLLLNTFLINTKPPIKKNGEFLNERSGEWMYICITESGRELLRELNRREVLFIKNCISNILYNNGENNVVEITNRIEQEIKEKAITIENLQIWGIKMMYCNNVGKVIKITLWKKEFFVKVIIPKNKDSSKNSAERYNVYQEAISLEYIRQSFLEIIQSVSTQYNNITINILHPLYSFFNKENKLSLAIYPYIKDHIWFDKEVTEKEGHHYPLTDDEIDDIKEIIAMIKRKVIQLGNNIAVKIKDIYEERNILLSKNDEWIIHIYLIDPTIETIEPTNPHTQTQRIHKLFTQNP